MPPKQKEDKRIWNYEIMKNIKTVTQLLHA
jgi:hypothetical protein